MITGPESLSQAEQVRVIGEAIGRRILFQELSPDEFRRETAGSWPSPVVDMLLAAWGAAMGRPACAIIPQGHRIARAHVSPMGRRSRRRVSRALSLTHQMTK